MNHATAKAEYQRLYGRLFALIVARSPCDPELPECDDLRQRMNAAAGSDKEKVAWGVEIGTRLYEQAVYGKSR